MKRIFFTLTPLLLLAPAAHAVEVVADGDFESPSASAWTSSAGDAGNLIGAWGVPGMTGRSARLAVAPSDNLFIDQEVDLLGYQAATFTCDVTTVAHGAPNSGYLDINLGSDTLALLKVGSAVDGEVQTQHLSIPITGIGDFSATSLAFFAGNDASSSNQIYVDNVSIKTQAVPEPATLCALGTGLFGVLRRRRNP